MKREKYVTMAILTILGACLFIFSGCGSQDNDISVQDWLVASKLYTMESTSDCLTCIGCMHMEESGCGGTYYGCIDCFGLTVDDNATADDIFWERKIYGGLCGSSCLSCYWVNFSLPNSDGKVVPVYGCMSGG